MRRGGTALTVAAISATLLAIRPPGRAAAQEERPNGAALFKSYCASCHGREAKGDGPLAESLRTLPPDLTRFAERNGGEFDAEKVFRIVDGRNPVKNHGGPDMPVWGDAFKRAGEGYSEGRVKDRIDALVEHLRAVQKTRTATQDE